MNEYESWQLCSSAWKIHRKKDKKLYLQENAGGKKQTFLNLAFDQPKEIRQKNQIFDIKTNTANYAQEARLNKNLL